MLVATGGRSENTSTQKEAFMKKRIIDPTLRLIIRPGAKESK